MINDLTKGNPLRLILMFMLPVLLGNIFQQLYNMADTLIVGRTISMQALAAVGATGAISFMILGFIQGMTSGFSVITAQRYGARDYDGVRRSIAATVLLSGALTLVITLVSALSAKGLLRLMNTPDDIMEDAYHYIIVIYLGSVATVFYNMISNIIRALGDSKTPLIFLIIASVINIILDLVFILYFSMGVAGAAWATVIAQGISGILCLIYAKKKMPLLNFKKEDWKQDRRHLWMHLRMGFPMGFQLSVMTIGVIAVQTALNGFGSTTVAAYTAASKIEQLTEQPLVAFGVTMSTYAAQNYGAGLYDRIRSGVKKCNLLGLLFCVVGYGLVFFLGGALSCLFLGNGQPEAVRQAQEYLNIVVLFYFFLGLIFIYRSTLQGVGNVTAPFLSCIIELFMRTAVAILFSKWLGYTGVCFATPLAWVGAAVQLVICYYFVMRKIGRRPEPRKAV